MISFIQSCSIDTTAYFSILTTIIIIKVHKNNFQIINLSHSLSPGYSFFYYRTFVNNINL